MVLKTVFPDEESRVSDTPAGIGAPPRQRLVTPEEVYGTVASSTVRSVMSTNPDKAAEAKRIAGEAQLPMSTVERNLDEISNEQRLKKIRAQMAVDPVLARQLTDPAFAAISHDDTTNLSAIASSLKPIKSDQVVTGAEFSELVTEVKKRNPSLDWDTARSVATTIARVDNSEGGIRTSRSPNTNLTTLVQGLGAAFTESFAEQTKQGIRRAFGDATGLTGMASDAARKALQSRDREFLTTPKPEGLAGDVYQGLQSTVQTAPVIAASLVNPAFGLTLLGAQTAAPAYDKYRTRGGTGAEAALGAGLEAGAEVYFERSPLGFLTRKLGRIGAVDFMTGLLKKELPAEIATTIAQSATDTAIANPTKTWGAWAKELPEQLRQTVIGTLVQGGVMGGLHAGVRQLGLRGEEAAQAEKTGEFLNGLFSLSEASKVRERDPSSLNAFIRDANTDGPVQDLYIDSTVLGQSLQQAGFTPEQAAQLLPSLAEQFKNGPDAGDSYRIPLSEALTFTSGTGLEKLLLQHARTSEDGMSAEEAKVFMQGHADQFKAAAEQAAVEGTDATALAESTKTVHAKLAKQLTQANRFTADVNNKYATLVSEMYTVLGARDGLTPEQMYAKYPLLVRAERPTSEGRVLQPKGVTQKIVEMLLGTPALTPDGIAAHTTEKGGGTFDLRTNQELGGTEGYAVSTHLDRQQIVEGSPTAQHVADYIAANNDLLSQPGKMLGTWANGGKTYLDVSHVEPTLDAALAIGRDAKQLAVMNLANFEEIAVPGVNSLSQAPNPAEARAIKKMMGNLTPREQKKVGNALARKIVEHLTTLPSANEFAAVAYAGRAKRGWYSESAEAISTVFGPDAPRFAMLLAALSPQVPVETNLGNALRIWRAWDKAGRPSDREAIIDIMAQNVEGKGGRDSVLEAWVNNTERALGSYDVNDITLSGPKVNSFYLNLIGDVLEVTNDSWMARFALIERTVFGGKLNPNTGDPGKSSAYLAVNARVREAAKTITKLTGEEWTPAEVQETVWTWTQGLMNLADNGDVARKPSDVIRENGLEAVLNKSTPNFGDLFLTDKYRSILEEAGYADELRKLQDADGANAPEPGSDIGLEGEAGPFATSSQQRYELTAARRLDAQWEARRLGRELYQSAGPEGTAGVAEAQAAADDLDRGSQRLDGLPDKPLLIAGEWYVPGPNAQAHTAAQEYMASTGMRYDPPRAYARVDTVRAAKIAAEFDKMKHDPTNPEVALAYQALIEETLAQWQAIKATGLKVEFIDFEKTGDPYAESPRQAIRDVQDNNHLWVFPTDAGFGSDATDISGNPLLALTDEYIDGKQLRANDVFRIVHDYFGHIKDGVGFRAEGEENAWRSHAAMFSPLARRALTTETRGQNSWVNYGPHGKANQKASAADTIYAPQKIGLLPQWVVDDGRMDTGEQDKDPNFPSYGTPTPGSISVLGVHFSMGDRTLLSSAMYGTGAVGAERDSVLNATDQRLKDRVYFYTPEGKGIISERKVGGVAHGAKLNNIYDATNDPLGIWAKGGESAVIDAGFDGYYARNTNLLSGQGVTILLGQHTVPVARLGFERDVNAILKGQPKTRVLMQTPMTPALEKFLEGSTVKDVVYHWTTKDFDAFKRRVGDVGIHVGTAGQANDRGLYLRGRHGDEGFGHVIPLYISLRNPFRMDDAGAWNMDNMDYVLKKRFPMVAERIRGMKSTKDIREFLQDHGYDGIVYKNTGEVEGAHVFQEQQNAALEVLHQMLRAQGKPLNVFDTETQATPEYRAWSDAMQAGNDFRNAPENGADSYILFEPTQLKSAVGNSGAFNRKDKNILKQDLTVIEPVEVVDNEEGTPRGQKTALFGEGDAYLNFKVSPTGKVTLYSISADGGVRGRDMVDWLARTHGAPTVVEVVPESEGFWDKMQEEGRVRAWRAVKLWQDKNNARGSLSFEQDITSAPGVITLLQNADLSTFLHESGHFFLEVMSHMAAQPNAPAGVVNDMNVLMKWFGISDLATWRGMALDEQRDSHERFARAFEAYLFEGKSPNVQMQGLFSTFRTWLMRVYKQLTNLNVELTGEVRGVFDRMLASEERIREAEAVRGYAPLFASAKEMGATDEEWVAYQQAAEGATEQAVRSLQEKSLRNMGWLSRLHNRTVAKLTKDADEKRKLVRREVLDEVRQQPVYAVQRFIKYGELPDGTQAVGAKLSLPALKEFYGEGPAAPWRYLNNGKYGLVTSDAEGSLSPDTMAEMFGFGSGDEMIRAILAADPESATVDGMTDQRMLERYSNMADPQAIEAAANSAIHNEARMRFVATELNALTKATGPARLVAKAARDFADSLIASKKVRELRAGQFTAAEARSAKNAMTAVKKGDTVLAATEKRNQLVNGYAAKATASALTEVEKGVEYLRKFDREGGRKSLDVGYLDQIDKLLERFEFRNVSLREIDKRETLAQWLEQQRDDGFEPDVPQELQNEAARTNYKNLTVEEFRGLLDTVRQIEHLARLKKKLLTAKDQREFDAIRIEITNSINEHAGDKEAKLRRQNTILDRAGDFGNKWLAMHRKMASLARELDGFKDGGPMWEFFVRSMNAAGDREAVMREKATMKLFEIINPILDGGKMGGKGQYFESVGQSFNREERIAMALNVGNASNKQRLLGGEGWTDAQVAPILATLTERDWKFVQSVWDFFESYRPEIGAKEKRIYGKEPKWVEATPVATPFGTLRGGYYPVKFDPRRSGRAEQHADAEGAKSMMRAAYTSATTRRSFTKTRVEEVSGRPLQYSFTGIYQGANEVIHDLSWHEWLIDVNRLLRSSSIDAAIRNHYGPETVQAFKNAVKDIALGDTPAENAFETAINHVRQGATIAGLGWNITTSLLQPLGLTQSMVRIGPQWVAKGMASWAFDSESTQAKVYDKSDFMRLRAKTMQREIAELRNVVNGSKLTALEGSYFYLIQKMQQVADIPTWLGAYEKQLAAGNPEERAVALADSAVLDAQGGGQQKDLSQVQRGGPLMKLFTNFYSFFNTTYNLTVEQTKATDFKSPLSVGLLAVDYLLLFIVPATMGALLKMVLKGTLKDDDDKEIMRKLAAENINYLMGTMVGARELGGLASAIAGKKGPDYSGPAGLRFFSEMTKLSQQAAQGEADKAFWRALNSSGGILLHYPSGAVQRFVEGAIDMKQNGNQNPGVLLVGPQNH